MNRDRQIELMQTAVVRTDERVTAWIANPQVKAALRANAAMMRDIKYPQSARRCG